MAGDAIMKLDRAMQGPTLNSPVVWRMEQILEARQALEELVATAAYLDGAKVLELDTLEHETTAVEVLREIRRVKDQAEDARKALVAPPKGVLAAVDKVFRVHRKVLEDAERQVRAKMAQAAERKRARQEALQRQAMEAAKANDLETANAALAAAGAEEEASPEGTSYRWDWSVSAIRLEHVPRSYLMVDMSKVKAEIRQATEEGREPQVPGVVFAKTATPIVRTK